MGETLRVGDSFLSWIPSKQRQPDGSYSYVQDPVWGVLSVPVSKTIIEIVPRPENEEEAALLVRNLLAKTTENQNVVDGKLWHKDNREIGHLFDPTIFYIIES